MSTHKKIFKRIPLFPLSALVFYVFVFTLWENNIIPSPAEMIEALETMYFKHGMSVLVLATSLESLVYICLYIPGAFVIALAAFFSDGSFFSLLKISLTVAITLTFTSIINYFLGRIVSSKGVRDKLLKGTDMAPKGLLISMLHPNFLAFYFFHAGLEHKHIKNILFVPIFMIPYGLLVAYLLSVFSTPARKGLEDPYFLLLIVLIWFVTSTIKEHKKHRKKKA